MSVLDDLVISERERESRQGVPDTPHWLLASEPTEERWLPAGQADVPAGTYSVSGGRVDRLIASCEPAGVEAEDPEEAARIWRRRACEMLQDGYNAWIVECEVYGHDPDDMRVITAWLTSEQWLAAVYGDAERAYWMVYDAYRRLRRDE